MLPKSGKNVENTDTNSFTSAAFTALILAKLTVAQQQYLEIICTFSPKWVKTCGTYGQKLNLRQ
jgi:hypothetical protein